MNAINRFHGITHFAAGAMRQADRIMNIKHVC